MESLGAGTLYEHVLLASATQAPQPLFFALASVRKQFRDGKERKLLWAQDGHPKWNAVKLKHGLKPAVPWWYIFYPYPNASTAAISMNNHICSLFEA